jgi:hypothetical protein
MGVFGTKGGLQDHGPVKRDVPVKWRWIAKRRKVRVPKSSGVRREDEDSVQRSRHVDHEGPSSAGYSSTRDL